MRGQTSHDKENNTTEHISEKAVFLIDFNVEVIQ